MWTLVFWTVVASSNAGTYASNLRIEKDWRPIAEVRTEAACHKAAKHLNLKPELYRCINPT